MTSLDDRISQLSPAKRRLLELRLQELGAKIQTNQGIPRRTTAGPVPLSYGQQRFWFVHELEPELPLYNNLSAARIRGPLDVQALQHALAALVTRHEILRTLYIQDSDGQPLQSVCSNWQFAMPVIDLRQDPDAEQTVRRLLIEQAHRRFDLTREISVRACLYVMGEQDFVFCEVHHHIATDFWSSGIMKREVHTLYDAYRKGQVPSLPDLPIQYADFAVWQRQQEKSEEFARQLDYWRLKLAGSLPTLNLPARIPRTSSQAHRGASAGIFLEAELVTRLLEMGRTEGATLFMVLTAAFLALFQRHARQDDLVVGVLNAGRTRVEMESLVGTFINVLVFRTDVSGNPTFRELLRRTRQVAIDAFANQDIPFERLVAETHPDRSPNADPIVQVMLDFLNSPGSRYALPGVDWNPVTVDKGNAEYEMLIAVRPDSGGLAVSVRYLKDLYDAGTIARLLEHLVILLEAAVSQPDQRLADLPLLSKAERDLVLYTWNETAVDFERPASNPSGRGLERCFHHLFEDQAALTPHAIAVRDASNALTYAELNVRANRLARALQHEEVFWNEATRPQPIIALLADRDVDFLAAMLATFKLGGVYLPLDPRSPAARLRQVLSQSQAACLLVSEGYAALGAEALGEPGAGYHAELTTEPGRRHQGEALTRQLALTSLLAADYDGANLDKPIGPRHGAYVIYTSGSTGVPKGAIIEHRGMLNHLYAKVRDLALTNEDILAQTAPQIFDISVWQFLATLITGGCVHIFPDEIAFDPTVLLDSVKAAGVTMFETVPSMMRAMLEAAAHPAGVAPPPKPPALDKLRWLIPTGEALPPVLSREWFQAYPALRQLNAYGPTECSDDVTHYPITEAPAASVNTIPVGKPVPNMRLYVLDGRMQPVPIGVIGELYVGGVGVGRGYLNDPVRTAEVFLPDPFGSERGARLYRTGDLARHLPDGNIEFQGRGDYQVKIRGMRIELGDVEAALLELEGVKEAAVLAPESGPHGKQLVGYLARKPGRTLTAACLTADLRERLPVYMTPTVFVILDDLPKTATGKIDRKSLPIPDQETQRAARPFVAPGTGTEMRVDAIWKALLKLPAVGIHEDFFEVGGESLLAAQLIYRLRAEFSAEVPLRALFEYPTIAGLAAYLDARVSKTESTQAKRHLLSLQPKGSRPPLYLLPGGGGGESEYLHVYANFIHHLGSDQPVYGFQAQTADGAEFPFDTVEQMAGVYVSELRRVQPRGPYFLAGECIGAKVALEMARQLATGGDTVAELVFLNAVVTGTASQASASGRVQHAIRTRMRQLRALPAPERLPRLKTMASHAAVAILPVSDRQRRQQAQRSARLGYMALLRSYTPKPYDGNVTLLMTGDLAARGRAEAWHNFVRGRLTVAPLIGVHRTYLGIHVAANAVTVKECLEATQEYLGAQAYLGANGQKTNSDSTHLRLNNDQ